LESLDPDPGPDPHFLESLILDPDQDFDPEKKFLFCFFDVNEHKFVVKNKTRILKFFTPWIRSGYGSASANFSNPGSGSVSA